MNDFELFTKNKIRYLSTQFGYNYEDLLERKNGVHGEGQALMVSIMEDWSFEFITAIKEGKKLNKLYGVEYLTIKRFAKLCDLRVPQIEGWESKEKIDLREGFLNTPECYAYWKKSTMETKQAMDNLFPIIKKNDRVFEPVPNVCDQCIHRSTCKAHPENR